MWMVCERCVCEGLLIRPVIRDDAQVLCLFTSFTMMMVVLYVVGTYRGVVPVCRHSIFCLSSRTHGDVCNVYGFLFRC